MPIAVGETFERYEIESLIGRGGMGEVYRAVDTRLRRKVALKVLRPDREGGDAVARLFREARLAAGFAHPNTVAIHDVGEAEGIFYIVMELVTGSSLLAYVGDDRAPTARKLGWLVDVARALSAAHKAGVIHRDVKPSNVMVSDDDVVKVLDFGLAKPLGLGLANPQGPGLASPLAPLSFRTMQGHVLGTPRYMAPEQLAGADVDSRSDQYAFGLTAYELIAGKHPGGAISGPTPAPPLDAVVPAVSRLVAQVVARTMETNPEDRFVSMEDVAVALEDAIAGRAPRGAAPGAKSTSAGPASEITAMEVPATGSPMADTVRFDGDDPSRSAATAAVTTKRAGGGGAAVVAQIEILPAAVDRVPKPGESESDVPTASANTTAEIMATIAAGSELSPRATTMTDPEALEKAIIAPTGLEPHAIAHGSARPPDRTLLSREAPVLPAPMAKTMLAAGNERPFELPKADAKADANAKAKADADAKAKAKAKADADARARAKALGATTGSGRIQAVAPKRRRSVALLAVALVILGICAFAGAYYGSKGLTGRPTPTAPSAPHAPSRAPAASSRPESPAPSGTPSATPLPHSGATVPTPAPTPTPRPAPRPKPTASVPSSLFDVQFN